MTTEWGNLNKQKHAHNFCIIANNREVNNARSHFIG